MPQGFGTGTLTGRLARGFAADLLVIEGYADYFHGSVRFNDAYAGVTVPAAWRNAACPLADAGMHHAAMRRLETDRGRLDSPERIGTRVAMLLTAQATRVSISGPPPSA